MEIDYQLLVNRLFIGFSKPPSESEVCKVFEEYHEQHLAFLYEHDGAIWCQWQVPDKYLPRYKTTQDQENPKPPADAFKKWMDSYRTKPKGLSGNFRNLLKSSESSKKFPPVVVGVGEVVEVTEEETEIESEAAHDRLPSLAIDIEPKTFDLGMHGWTKLTEEQLHEITERVGPEEANAYIERFDNWVEQAPTAKTSSGPRKNRKPYLTILSWIDKDRKDGKLKPNGGSNGNYRLTAAQERQERSRANIRQALFELENDHRSP